jgi:L-cysteine S-thiosulfotransferase
LIGAGGKVRWGGWLAACAVTAGFAAAASGASPPYRVEGDAIRERLAAEPGDAGRGKQVVMSRDSNCLLCHSVPDAGARFMGDVGPPLAGVGARLNEGQLRLRIVDSLRLNRESIMPSYYRMDGLNKVAETWRGKPVLTAQQVEDTVAYLGTLR